MQGISGCIIAACKRQNKLTYLLNSKEWNQVTECLISAYFKNNILRLYTVRLLQ